MEQETGLLFDTFQLRIVQPENLNPASEAGRAAFTAGPMGSKQEAPRRAGTVKRPARAMVGADQRAWAEAEKPGTQLV